MKPNTEELVNPEVSPSKAISSLEGDIIGNTAYSQRFVLKILLKIANLETLKEALADKSFEDDLCILWDMTAEKDVVIYLKENNALKLINFALPTIEVPRIIEILIGVVGNMCCYDEVIIELMKMDYFIHNIFFHIKLFDPRILLEIQRLVSACVFRANHTMIALWMDIFDTFDYSQMLYFTLKSSSNRDLVITALENLNTICARCNEEISRTNFFLQFVTPEAIDSIKSGFLEVVVKQKDLSDDDMLERWNLITLQIILSITGFDKSHEMYKNNKEDVAIIVVTVLRFYIQKINEDVTVSADLSDIGESLVEISKMLQLSTLAPEKLINCVYDVWKALDNISKCSVDTKERCDYESTFEEDKQYAKMLNTHFGLLICSYMKNCSEINFKTILDLVGTESDDILNSTEDDNIKSLIKERISNCKTKQSSK